MPYSLVNGYECFGGAFWGIFTALQQAEYVLTETMAQCAGHNLEDFES
jgi:hypothetical protein